MMNNKRSPTIDNLMRSRVIPKHMSSLLNDINRKPEPIQSKDEDIDNVYLEDDWTYEKILERSLESEHDAVSLAVALAKKAPNKYLNKLLGIAQEEDNHFLIYTEMYEDLKGGGE